MGISPLSNVLRVSSASAIPTLNMADTPSWFSKGQIPSLNGLRALSICSVLIAHAHKTHGFHSPQVIHFICEWGAAGVDLFFVISGFLITTLLMRELDLHKSIGVRAFYIRRALRIMSAYLCFLGVIAALQLSGIIHIKGTEWIASTTYTVNFRAIVKCCG